MIVVAIVSEGNDNIALGINGAVFAFSISCKPNIEVAMTHAISIS